MVTGAINLLCNKFNQSAIILNSNLIKSYLINRRYYLHDKDRLVRFVL